MCTLIVASQWFMDAPLLVAANRDEHFARPARAPFVWESRHILSPRDEVAGGTWLGLNAHGVFVGITNRHLVPRDEARRSRGELVLEALEHPTAEAAFEAMRGLDATKENGFHLLMADTAGAYLVWGDGQELTARPLEPGIHVVTERSFDAAPTGREPLLAGRLADVPRGEALPERWWIDLLSLQVNAGHFDDVTVNMPDLGYGTRSSTFVTLGDTVRFRHAHGSPVTTPFDDYSAVARDLLSTT